MLEQLLLALPLLLEVADARQPRLELQAALLNRMLSTRQQRKTRSWQRTLTALAISSMSSPTYSLPVPLKGILVDTIETNTPIRSVAGLILYMAQLRGR